MVLTVSSRKNSAARPEWDNNYDRVSHFYRCAQHRREGSVLGGQSGNLLLGLSLPGFDPEADLSCLGEAFDSVPEALAAIQVHAGSNVDWDSYELHRGDDEEYWPDDDD